MDFTGIAVWIAKSIIGALSIWALCRLAVSYLRGKMKESKHEIKHFLMICFVFGILPGLGTLAVDTGKTLIKPITSVVNAVSDKVSDEATKSIKGN